MPSTVFHCKMYLKCPYIMIFKLPVKFILQIHIKFSTSIGGLEVESSLRMREVPGSIPVVRGTYTVSELEVRNLKPLEMIEKPNNFGITCLYLQEYKKAFAFSTKFHYFSDQKQHILHLKKQFFFSSFKCQMGQLYVIKIVKFC